MNLIQLIIGFGYAGITFAVFAESGLFIGFFLPGDSLLFTAGFLASQGIFSIVPLCMLAVVAAIAGDSVGYAFGRRIGPKIFVREESLFFNRAHLERARAFYARHGPKTIVLARFMPIVRTFAPILAGVGEMRYTTFLIYNVFGGTLWALGLPLAGYFLGRTIPNVDRYLLPIIIGIIVVSATPPFFHLLRNREDRVHILEGIRQLLRRR